MKKQIIIAALTLLVTSVQMVSTIRIAYSTPGAATTAAQKLAA